MRLRHNPQAAAMITGSPLVLEASAALAHKGRWAALFPTVAPLYLELGMGRGRFLAESAAANPGVNYLGLEQHEEVILEALAKLNPPPDNLRILHMNAALLGEAFAAGEAVRIYLHFPDPWPKNRHAKRRLTAPFFLTQYWTILQPGGELQLKTDNTALFDWSLDNLREAGWYLAETSHDLPADMSGVITEYEGRYRRRGQPICYLRAVKG